ncbi:benzoate 4-monooxygenase cytochrome P450 [Fusarium tjaetaba]|uniref:Benzoate 4-monooxygenase cytochrome P450 n=1 Tax=Fusarium tjaetaba TaxID=1567544 RepID=A0A8H5VHC2_9HYPO|nr:benzoate 4-monooxygenase cytochrome P450 [Fusarium tjaetaba]KAF5622160.1 benzoate 4-monooxygenase cytochrome P450 [Fusarium tjaetaba]
MFAHQRIAKGKPDVDKVLDALWLRYSAGGMKEANSAAVNVLNLSHILPLDTVAVYLFGECFHGISNGRLHVTEFIHSFVAGVRFFHLPGRFYDFVDKSAGAFMLHHNPEVLPNPCQFMPGRWLNPSQEMVRDSFYFGAGSRQCIARNLASAGLWWAVETLIQSDVLRGAKVVQDKIEIV